MPLIALSYRNRPLYVFFLLSIWVLPLDRVCAEEPVRFRPPTITIGETQESIREPTLSDDADPNDIEIALQTARGKYPLSRFTKDSIVAPFRFERESIRDSNGARIGHRLDLWFVAHGSLDTIRDRKLLETFMQSNDDDSSRAKELAPAQLASRGIEASQQTGRGWITFETEILDRVAVRGVLMRQVIDRPESILASAVMDDRFGEDGELPNQWWSAREEEPTIRHPYGGLAGYAKATSIPDQPGSKKDDALLVECHAIISEPNGWFDGANLLGSKLPLVVQDAVRKFRRTLDKHRR